MALQKKDIKYLNRDFTSLRTSLIDYTKTYFSSTYNDFSPSSPGMMFIEMSSYVGDVLSFYLDNQIQETYLQYARQTDNLFELAYMFGYKPKVTGVATTTIDFYQQIPSKLSGSISVPDFDYTLLIPASSTIKSSGNTDISYLVEDSVDFSVSSSLDPTEITIYQSSGGTPVSYLLKKSKPAISATINTTTFTFTTPVQFDTRTLIVSDLVGVLDIVDSDGNTWYEVDHLAQDMVYNKVKNTNPNTLTSMDTDTPYILKLEQVQRRFTTRFLDSGSIQIQFGAGVTDSSDEEIIPNPNNVGLGLPFEQSKLTTAYSPTNFIFTKTYGIAPSSTTLTVRYLTGGGVSANRPANDLTIFSGTATYLKSNLNAITANIYRDSLAVTNPTPGTGGSSGDSIEELRQNTLANHPTQLRTVTSDDYLIRTYSLPATYGTVAKAYVEKTKATAQVPNEPTTTLDLYVLTYDQDKHLIPASNTLKQNISTYLSQYRIIGDSISIRDAYVVNIGVDFEITVDPNYNSSEVLLRCIQELQEYFRVDNWQINQPILFRDVNILLDKVEGVRTVKTVNFENLAGESLGYSKYSYDTQGATIDNVLYPSIDPMIFEVKYPTVDIKGRVVSL